MYKNNNTLHFGNCVFNTVLTLFCYTVLQCRLMFLFDVWRLTFRHVTLIDCFSTILPLKSLTSRQRISQSICWSSPIKPFVVQGFTILGIFNRFFEFSKRERRPKKTLLFDSKIDVHIQSNIEISIQHSKFPSDILDWPISCRNSRVTFLIDPFDISCRSSRVTLMTDPHHLMSI